MSLRQDTKGSIKFNYRAVRKVLFHPLVKNNVQFIYLIMIISFIDTDLNISDERKEKRTYVNVKSYLAILKVPYVTHGAILLFVPVGFLVFFVFYCYL